MWGLFKKKADVQECKPKKHRPTPQERNSESIATLRAWRDIGQEFYFLGKRMVVSRHYRTELSPGPCFLQVPELRAWYVDNNGVLRDMVLREVEALALAARNDESAMSERPTNGRADATASPWERGRLAALGGKGEPDGDPVD